MNIIIYDDNKSICDEISDYIKGNFSFNIFSCISIDELNDILNSHNEIDAIILDIVLENGANGISLASQIHKRFPDIQVIFLTGYDSYYKDIFTDFQPYGFIAKPIQYNILNFFLKKLLSEYNLKNKTISITSNYKEYTVPLKTIKYIQSRKRICEIVTEAEVFCTYLKISDIQEKLSDNFVRCHQSYIVNLDYVESFEKNQFFTKDDEYIPISKKYYPAIKEAYPLYISQNRRIN